MNDENDSVISVTQSTKTSTALGSGSNKSSSSNEQTKDKAVHGMSYKESKAVYQLRVGVFCALLLAAIIVSVIVYGITKMGETNEFETQYDGMSGQLINTFNLIISQKLSVLGPLRIALMAHAIDREGQTAWPFVTCSSFQQRAATSKRLSNSFFVGVHHVVNDSDKTKWEEYVASEGPKWMSDARKYQTYSKIDLFDRGEGEKLVNNESNNYDDNVTQVPITYNAAGGSPVEDTGPGPYLVPSMTTALKLCLNTSKVVFGDMLSVAPGDVNSTDKTTAFYSQLLSIFNQSPVAYEGDAISQIFVPVFGSYRQEDTKTVAVLVASVQWKSFFKNVLPEQATGIYIVFDNSCQQPFTYIVYGSEVTFLGRGDLHDNKFTKYERSSSFGNTEFLDDGTDFGLNIANDYCPISIKVYPSQEYYDQYNSNMPITMTFTVLVVFMFTAFMFLIYDRLVERRQVVVLTKALQSSAIVSSLFPQSVTDRLLQQSTPAAVDGNQMSNKNKLKSLLNPDPPTIAMNSNPIADLFPHTTVLFADICGFTAWSSSREPTQVFILLQSVYQAFDYIAKCRKVFKVETIGDCYVAVTGLPDPQEDHAIIMAKFAAQCLSKMHEIAGELDLRLGPGTSDLTMRMGLHSGPVTGGVLLGEKARFQLFGDTVNTAARMESTGRKDKIQVSSETASLLMAGGKSHWLTPREDQVVAKGKGVLTTFWLDVHSHTVGKSLSFNSNDEDMTDQKTQIVTSSQSHSPTAGRMKHEKKIDWICELLQTHIRKVIASRTNHTKEDAMKSQKSALARLIPKNPPMEEVVESIVLPAFQDVQVQSLLDVNDVVLSFAVTSQLRNLISDIASKYVDNPFHNFEHACHVTMSATKLLMRVVSPDLDLDAVKSNQVASRLHDFTLGIHSDPITQLAIVFSAIIHDVDHRGVSNVQLCKEEATMAARYGGKSVAEQNSLDIAWTYLMSEQYQDLRECMFATDDELKRFRQIVVNAVLATDIFDKELNDLRKQRWEKAFIDTRISDGHERNNLKATIVIEHLMQASDVAHTMQHWHVYRKWNADLFKELYMAYIEGRLESNPAVFWYEGELSFFDNYVIPLAKKLKDCNVFGVSSDEYLNYAEKNRAEWEARGQEIVVEMIDDVNQNNQNE